MFQTTNQDWCLGTSFFLYKLPLQPGCIFKSELLADVERGRPVWSLVVLCFRRQGKWVAPDVNFHHGFLDCFSWCYMPISIFFNIERSAEVPNVVIAPTWCHLDKKCAPRTLQSRLWHFWNRFIGERVLNQTHSSNLFATLTSRSSKNWGPRQLRRAQIWSMFGFRHPLFGFLQFGSPDSPHHPWFF